MKRLITVFLTILLFTSCGVLNPSPDYPEPNFKDHYGKTWSASIYKCPSFDEAHVILSPEDDVEKIIRSSSKDTKFFFNRGIYYSVNIRPKKGMSFFTEGAVFNGGGIEEFAFEPIADNVTICGFNITNYTPGAQMGAIKGGGHSPDDNTYGWVIMNSEIHNNDGGGIRTGHHMKVLGNRVYDNSQIGIAGSGDNTLVEGNEIFNQNLDQEYSYKWEAGGTKFVMTNNLVVRNNYVHDNFGAGLWTDIDNDNVLYEGNLVTDNAASGIFQEIGYSATIKNNTVKRNGYDRVGSWAYGAGILIGHSSGIEIFGNFVVDNTHGIILIQQERANEDTNEPYLLDDVWVHHNTIVQRHDKRSWAVGVAEDISGKEVFSRRFKFDHNTYILISAEDNFRWDNKSMSWDKWRRSGFDLNSTLNE